MARWTRRLAPSASLDQNIRTALWVVSLVSVAATLFVVLSAGLSAPLVVLALAGLGFLAGHWGSSRRATRVRWTGDVLDALAVVAVVTVMPLSLQVLTLSTSAVLQRSIRPGRRAALVRLALQCAAIGAGVLVSGALAGDAQATAALGTVTQATPGLIFSTALAQLLSSALVRTERAGVRTAALTEGGMRLMAASTAQEVLVETSRTADALAASVRGVVVGVVAGPARGTGRGLWSGSGGGSGRAADRTVGFGARQDDGRFEACGPYRAVEEVLPSLTALAQYVGLSLQKCEVLEELRQRAETDGLTGLVSAESFRKVLGALVAGTEDGDVERRGTLLMVDCDDFKTVNDTYGHVAGDAVLLETARRLRADTRSGDVVARLGGDEFAVLLAPASEHDTDSRVERLTAALARPVETGGHRVEISCSVGSTPVLPGRSPEELVRAADSAMYTAKAAGKGRHVTADPVRHGALRAVPSPGGGGDDAGRAAIVGLAVAAER